ncbi:unnamed protein product [Rhodiola kirilowii]
MGSDGAAIDDQRKKHRRSSDAKAEETTKRRKHKHRHHSHHRSKKREEVEDDVEMEADVLPPVVVELKKDCGDNDEMEEGEIVEENGGGCEEDEKEVENHLGNSVIEAVDGPDSTVYLCGSLGGDSDEKHLKQGIKIDQAGSGECVSGDDILSILDNSEQQYKMHVHSPYRSRSPDELSFGTRSGSYYPIDRSGSQSRSDVEAPDTLKGAHKLNGKYLNDSDNDLSFRHDHSDHRRSSRDRSKDNEREPSNNYSRKVDRRDKKYDKEVSDKDLDAGDVDRVRRHEMERGSDRYERREREWRRSRTREQVKDRSRGNDKDQERRMDLSVIEKEAYDRKSEMATERERKHGREREKEIDMNLYQGAKDDRMTGRTLERDRYRDTEAVNRHRGREREQYRVKEREREYSVERTSGRDKGRERELSVDRARGRKRDGRDTEHKSIDLSTEQDREKDRVRDPSNDRAREPRIESSYRERENRPDRSTNRYRNAEDNFDRNRKYDGSSSNRERQSEYKRFGNAYNCEEDRTKTEDTSKLDTHKREEDEHEEYQERISLQLAEEEEDDVNRIKEESRRRRQAILEKYKNMKLQDQIEPHSVGIDKGSNQEKLPVQLADASIPSTEAPDDKSDSFAVAKSPVVNGDSAVEHTSTKRLGDGTPKSERSDDMFCDDIFGETPTGVRKTVKGDSLLVERNGLNDNWDDAEGYYSYRFGELLDGRYEIMAAQGKGVFSSVVRAKDLKAGKGEPEEVAIKIIRNNETMYKAGQSELIILNKLVGADPEDRRHCVRFLSSFKYRNHLCLVFESLHMNLREVLKKFGRNIGLKLTAVRVYAKQLLIALKHLRNCGVLHCDIKPDNMLVNESKNVLKLCDFGNAMFAGKNEITPYLVSRFYRAPEIIIGLPYDHPVDIWSIGCCLYELYTGKVLFPGATNNDMLRLHMELKGPFPKKMLRKGAFIEQHFDQDLNFLSSEDDPVTKKTIKKMIVNIKPKDIGSIISGSPGEDPKMLTTFKDLLDKIFMLDPDKRLTVSQALAHPFITGLLQSIMATIGASALKKAPREGILAVY